ncbi:hypothetical protein V1L54_28470 [Streptomyces sp. TRM 70361]|uniref:hypothetical protein n=1 Tax=Streptomyces sp. TRM 70361 TaxID=3116553 RepID=UPI002E7B46E1|nr:hypothetical protein [Streptomyces sp. TRM 70361]MEE1943293.1 hypothetical protein [Streptomyces sp. TRM 70361]
MTARERGEPSAREGRQDLTAEELRTLDRAELILTARCMRARGFWYDSDASGSAPPAEQTARNPGRRIFPYGINDVAWARTHGFGEAGAGERHGRPSPARNANLRYFEGLSPKRQKEYQVSLGGTRAQTVSVRLTNGYTIQGSKDGCMSEAQHLLYGDFTTWYRASTIVNNLDAESSPKIFEDPAYKKAVSRWSSCMAGAGHPADSPQELRERFVERFGELPEESREAVERRLAVAEAKCVRATGLARTGTVLEERYAEQERAFRRAEIETRHRMRLDALPRAADIVSRSN